MSWTYTANPSTSPVDMVRFRLGDVEPSRPLVSDEECLQALDDEHGNSWLAAATLAEQCALRFFSRPTRRQRGKVIDDYGSQGDNFRILAQTLRLQASLRTTMPYAGGLSQGEKDAQRRDADRVAPFATVDLHTTPARDRACEDV